MGRSNRESRPGQKADGGGLVNPSMIGAGVNIAPQGDTIGSGLAKAMAKAQGGGAGSPPPLESPPMDDSSGGDDTAVMQQLGGAVGAMRQERGARKLAKKNATSDAKVSNMQSMNNLKSKSKIKLRAPV